MSKGFIFVLAFALLVITGAARADSLPLESFTSLDQFQVCLRSNHEAKPCMDKLDLWLESHQEDHAKVGALISESMEEYYAFPYFAAAFESGDIFCNHDGLTKSVVSVLSFPARENEKAVEAARRIFLDRCFAPMKDAISDGLINPNVFANICKGMAEKDALSNQQALDCSVIE